MSARVQSFGLNPGEAGLRVEVRGVGMSDPSVSAALTMPVVERRDWCSSRCNSAPGDGEGALPGAVRLKFWDLPQWGNTDLSQCLGENQFCFLN